RQGLEYRLRIGLLEQGTLDRALCPAVSTHPQTSPEQDLVIPEPAQFVGQALRPVEQFLAQRRATVARIGREHQLAVVARPRCRHDARTEAMSASCFPPGCEFRG